MVFSPDSDDSIELNVIDSSSSSTDEEEHSGSGNYELPKRFGLELLNATKHNTISPMKIILGEETRTTILIRNIPRIIFQGIFLMNYYQMKISRTNSIFFIYQ